MLVFFKDTYPKDVRQMKKLLFIGDICFGRDINDVNHKIVCENLAGSFSDNFVVANLESPIAKVVNEDLDHLGNSLANTSCSMKHFT